MVMSKCYSAQEIKEADDYDGDEDDDDSSLWHIWAYNIAGSK